MFMKLLLLLKILAICCWRSWHFWSPLLVCSSLSGRLSFSSALPRNKLFAWVAPIAGLLFVWLFKWHTFVGVAISVVSFWFCVYAVNYCWSLFSALRAVALPINAQCRLCEIFGYIFNSFARHLPVTVGA